MRRLAKKLMPEIVLAIAVAVVWVRADRHRVRRPDSVATEESRTAEPQRIPQPPKPPDAPRPGEQAASRPRPGARPMTRYRVPGQPLNTCDICASSSDD